MTVRDVSNVHSLYLQYVGQDVTFQVGVVNMNVFDGDRKLVMAHVIRTHTS